MKRWLDIINKMENNNGGGGGGAVVQKVDSTIHWIVIFSSILKLVQNYIKAADIELIINETKLQLNNIELLPGLIIPYH